MAWRTQLERGTGAMWLGLHLIAGESQEGSSRVGRNDEGGLPGTQASSAEPQSVKDNPNHT